MACHVEMMDFGALSYFLGIEVASCPRGYFLSQFKYTMDVIEHAFLIDTKTVDSPLESNVHYLLSDGIPLTDHTLHIPLLDVWFISLSHIPILFILFTLSDSLCQLLL